MVLNPPKAAVSSRCRSSLPLQTVVITAARHLSDVSHVTWEPLKGPVGRSSLS